MGQVDRSVFYRYAARAFRSHKVKFKLFDNLDLKALPTKTYFHDSAYIPYLLANECSVKCVSGTHFLDRLKALDPGMYVILSIRDDGSQALDPDTERGLRDLGITLLSRTSLYHSFIWIAKKVSENGFTVISEQCSLESLVWEGSLGEVNAIIRSQGARAGNHCAIMIDGLDYSRNLRGMNVAIIGASNKDIQSFHCDTFATVFCDDSLFLATSPQKDDARIAVAHAGGQIDGVNYTNCKEAVEVSYLRRGHRYFEIDLELTSDGEIVARHDWLDYLYDHLQQLRPEVEKDKPAPFAWFSETKILHRYTPLNMRDICLFLAQNKDAYIITDSKHLASAVVRAQFERIITAAQAVDPEVLSRIIPQIYNQEMLEILESIYPFPEYVYTLYQSEDTDQEVLQFVLGQPIFAVTMSRDRFNPGFAHALRESGTQVYVHTVNSPADVNLLLRGNATGFYTDTLTLDAILLEKRTISVEYSTTRNLLQCYLERRFSIKGEQTQSILAKVPSSKLGELASDLYSATSAEIAIELLTCCSEARLGGLT